MRKNIPTAPARLTDKNKQTRPVGCNVLTIRLKDKDKSHYEDDEKRVVCKPCHPQGIQIKCVCLWSCLSAV